MKKQNWSGSITSGGTVQELMPANGNRKGWQVQNTSDTDMYISEVSDAIAAASTPAVTGPSSFLLAPGAMYREYMAFDDDQVSTGRISIVGATTGKTFAAREW